MCHLRPPGARLGLPGALGAVSPRLAPRASSQTSRPCYSLMQSNCNSGWVSVTRSSAILGASPAESIRQVSCYTLLKGEALRDI